MGPIRTINIKDIYVYGFQDVTVDDEKKITSSAFFFIINAKTNKIKTYDYDKQRNEFEQEIRNLKLSEKYLEPQSIYWEYERYPDLEWFPEGIKKQLNEVKAKLKR